MSTAKEMDTSPKAVKQQLEDIWKNRENEILRKRIFRNLASCLAGLLNINPEGNNLICILGNGQEYSNLEALTNWVEPNYLHSLPWESKSNDDIEDLKIKLEEHLCQYRGY